MQIDANAGALAILGNEISHFFMKYSILLLVWPLRNNPMISNMQIF